MTLALAYDIDELANKAKLIPADWQKRLQAQQRALHVDHRVPGAQGQPEGHQGLGRPGQAGRRGHHAQPEDLGRRALELPGRLGLCAEEARLARRRRRSSSASIYRQRAGARLRRARLDDDLRRARHRRRAARLGERGAARAEGARPGQVRHRRAVAVASWPSRRSRWSTRWSTRRARARSRRPTSNTCTRPKARRSPARTTTARSTPRPRPSTPSSSRRSTCSPSTRCSAAGRKAQKTHFADGGVFDQIYTKK